MAHGTVKHTVRNTQDSSDLSRHHILMDVDAYAEQWADALHQWLGITDDCVHMVAKVM